MRIKLTTVQTIALDAFAQKEIEKGGHKKRIEGMLWSIRTAVYTDGNHQEGIELPKETWRYVWEYGFDFLIGEMDRGQQHILAAIGDVR